MSGRTPCSSRRAPGRKCSAWGGQLTTNVGEVLPLAKARDAHEMLAGERGHARGKIVLRVE
jgi:hypothetical protein